MEKRLLYAIAVFLVLYFAWNSIATTIWPPPPKPAPGAPRGGTGAVTRVGTPEPGPAPAAGNGAPAAPPAPSEHPAKTLDLESGRLSATVSSAGGGSLTKLDVWGCRHHEPHDRSVSGDPGIVNEQIEGRPGFLSVDVSGHEVSGIAALDWSLDEVRAADGAVVGTTSRIDRGGLRISTATHASADPAHPFHVLGELTVENVVAKPGVARVAEVHGPWTPTRPRQVIPEDGVLVAPVGADPEQLMAVSLAESLAADPNFAHNSETGWRYIGVRSDFYLSAIFPAPGSPLPKGTSVGFRAAKLKDPSKPQHLIDTAAASFRIPFETPDVGKNVTFKFVVYAGPNSRDVLAKDGSLYLPLEDAFPNRSFLFLRFGWMSRFLGWLLSILANAGLGWGMAVCALTILVRGALFPLSKKTQVSMRMHAKKMSALKPKLDAIKEKYADNPKKQQEMTMKAFREDKVSILPGGCLLAFLQMPVWISLYGTLQTTFEMRHASFLWFDDLTMPDHLLRIPGLENVWGLGGLTGGWLNLLPLLMMVTWWGSAAMQPLPDDPDQRAQAKMMRWIPLLFGVFLYQTAAGLTLYMTLSALWSIGESWLIKKVWVSKIELAPAKKP